MKITDIKPGIDYSLDPISSFTGAFGVKAISDPKDIVVVNEEFMKTILRNMAEAELRIVEFRNELDGIKNLIRGIQIDLDGLKK